MKSKEMDARSGTNQFLHRLSQDWGFAAGMWVLSRLLILVSVLLIAPYLSAPREMAAVGDWHSLVRWDSLHYLRIATAGYEYANDGKGHIVAFFPMLPLLMKVGALLGLPADFAGILVNNLAFLGALIVLYDWVNKSYGKNAARWSVAAAAWCPFSLFGTVMYTEGLFLLFSTAALRAFDRRDHLAAAVWGSLATATRLPGLALTPACLLVAWKEKRAPIAYFSALATAGGALLYSLFCWIQFGEPLAFLKVQRAWDPAALAPGQGWLKILVQIILGPGTWSKGRVADPLYPIAILAICGIVYLLWRFRHKLGSTQVTAGICLLSLLLWLLAGSPLVNILMVVGGGYLIWHFRRELQPVALTYGLFSLALILSSGRTASAERYMFGVVTVAIAFGLLLSRHSRWGYPVLGFFALLLTSSAIRFSQNLWAG